MAPEEQQEQQEKLAQLEEITELFFSKVEIPQEDKILLRTVTMALVIDSDYKNLIVHLTNLYSGAYVKNRTLAKSLIHIFHHLIDLFAQDHSLDARGPQKEPQEEPDPDPTLDPPREK